MIQGVLLRVLLAGLLFGALEAGGRQMQVDAGVSIDLIGIIQALIIVFIAAPLLVRAIFPWGFRKSRPAEDLAAAGRVTALTGAPAGVPMPATWPFCSASAEGP